MCFTSTEKYIAFLFSYLFEDDDGESSERRKRAKWQMRIDKNFIIIEHNLVAVIHAKRLGGGNFPANFHLKWRSVPRIAEFSGKNDISIFAKYNGGSDRINIEKK